MAVASDTNNYARKMNIFRNLVGMALFKRLLGVQKLFHNPKKQTYSFTDKKLLRVQKLASSSWSFGLSFTDKKLLRVQKLVS